DYKLPNVVGWSTVSCSTNAGSDSDYYSLRPDQRYNEETILIVGIIPGPKKPTHLNSFLLPLVQEMKLLDAVLADIYDANLDCLFKLHAYITVITGPSR
ncbi:hypothetical protein RUND412_011361, partial [Rhizina undulata]